MATTQPVASLITPTRRAREYETIYILRATVSYEEAERVVNRVKEVLQGQDGTLVKVDNWGRRKLAYLIDGASRGVFVYIRFVGYEGLVAELERNLRLLDSVLRFQTVLLQPRVELDKVVVDEAELQFAPLEEAEDEEEPGIAQRLGLVERPAPTPSGDEYSYEGRSDGDDSKEGASEAGAEQEAKPEAKSETEGDAKPGDDEEASS